MPTINHCSSLDWALPPSEAYTSNRVSSALRIAQTQILESKLRSQFLRRSEAIRSMVNDLCTLARLPHGWNSYTAEPPTHEAIQDAARFLAALATTNIFPSKAMPSAEGGIALRFKRGSRRALLEFLNSGEIDLTLYIAGGNVVSSDDSVSDTSNCIAAIEEHLAR